MRKKYWSCTKFADWIRGIDKPSEDTMENWKVWEKKSLDSSTIRHWIAENGLDALQDIAHWIPDKIYSVKYYINNRWVTKTNALTAHSRDIKPGVWSDVGNRFLPCLFNELVNFIEIEKACHNVAMDRAAREKYNAPFYSHGWFRWRTWRNSEAGVDHLRWESELTNAEFLPEDQQHLAELTHQAHMAREILVLYHWWTVVYRNRPDPHDAGGWTDYCSRMESANLSFANVTDAETIKIRDDALSMTREIEEAYEKEDTEMLKRLIDIRQSLWT